MLVFNNPMHKWNWLLCKLVELLSAGSILIFVTKKAEAEQVANNLTLKEYDVVLLHGDMDQADRNKVITKFKRKEVEIMVATDVAARGLDIPHIRTVVNYDIARDIDTHTHRIGNFKTQSCKSRSCSCVFLKVVLDVLEKKVLLTHW